MRVLATGANGHLGANVVRSLLARGYEVIPFVRQNADLQTLKGIKLEYTYGDVMEQRSLSKAAEGCDVMLHMAAVYRYWSKDPNEVLQTSMVGMRNALNAAKEAGLRRVVFTSSTWAVGTSEEPTQVRAATQWNEQGHTPYAVAKTQAEKEAWHLADKFGIEMIAICPSALIGPYDYRITPSTSLLLGIINGSSPVFKGGMSFVDVRDVAEVHAGAVEGGEVGQRYIAAGENQLMEQYAQIITNLTGVKPMRLPGGRTALQLVASLAEAARAITKSEPMLTRALANDIGGRYMFYDCTTTFRTFGLTPRTPQEILREGIRWLLHINQIKPDLAARLRNEFPPDPTW